MYFSPLLTCSLFVGFNPDIVKYKGVDFVAWDIKGGKDAVRLYLLKY